MIPDPNDEIRAIRDRLSASCGYDLERIFEETVRQQKESGKTFSPPPGNVQERRKAFLQDDVRPRPEDSQATKG